MAARSNRPSGGVVPACAELPRPNDDRSPLDVLVHEPERRRWLVRTGSIACAPAATGALDKPPPSTHWRYTETVARRYPHTIRTGPHGDWNEAEPDTARSR